MEISTEFQSLVLGVAFKSVLYFVSMGVSMELQYAQYNGNKRILPLNFNEWGQFRSPILLLLITPNVRVNINYFVRFEILNSLSMKIIVFWNVTMYSWEETYQHFGKTCCIHLQGEKARGCLQEYLFTIL